MKISNAFKNAIASNFYDKVIKTYSSEVTKDIEGNTNKTTLVQTGSFSGNVRFTDLDAIKEKYGIVEDINIVISTSTDVSVELGGILSYLEQTYEITKVIPTDSHKLITGVIWQQ